MALYLMLVPGSAFALLSIAFTAIFPDDYLTRVTFFEALIKGGVAYFVIFWIFTGINIAIWSACEYLLRRRLPTGSTALSSYPNVLLKRSILVVLVITAALTLYFATYQTLCDAVESGNIELAHRRLHFNLLGVGANTGYITGVSSIGTLTEPLLPVAAHSGNIEMARLLLEHGADPNKEGEFSDYHFPLYEAISKGYYPMVELLLAKGATAKRGMALAASLGQLDILPLLLDHGADPSAGLHAAARENRVEALQLLLDRGGMPDTKDSGGNTALDAAGVSRSDEAFALLSKYTTKLHDVHGFIQAGRQDLLQRALKSGMDPNGAHPKGPLLHFAIQAHNAAAVEILLQAGAKPDTVGLCPHHDGKKPSLHCAVEENALDAARILLRYGARPDCIDAYGRQPLHLAAATGTKEMVTLLCEGGANPNAEKLDTENGRYRPTGKTPLLVALEEDYRKDRLGVLEALLNGGANPNLGDPAPIEVAVRKFNAKATDLLIRHGADMSVKTSTDANSLLYLVVNASFVNPEYRKKRAPSMLATAKLLIANGANPAALNHYGETPLACAEREGNWEVADYLRPLTPSENSTHTAASAPDKKR
jgi:ankyrin